MDTASSHDAVADLERRSLVPVIFEPLARKLVERAAPRVDDTLLDAACGSGVVMRAAGEQLRFALGVDPNPTRLAAARQLSSALPRAGWCQARAEALPLPDAAFSLVTCQHGLMFFSDLDAGCAEIHRVLEPGGRLVASSWATLDQNPAFRALFAALAAHLGTAAERAAAVPFSLPDATRLEAPLGAAGFGQLETRSISVPIRFASVRDFVWRFLDTTSVAAFAKDAAAGVREAIAEEVEVALSEHAREDGLVLPAVALCVSGVKRAWS